MRPIDERTAFLRAVTFGVDELAEAERIMEWMIDFPDEAATYIVWLERAMQETD